MQTQLKDLESQLGKLQDDLKNDDVNGDDGTVEDRRAERARWERADASI